MGVNLKEDQARCCGDGGGNEERMDTKKRFGHQREQLLDFEFHSCNSTMSNPFIYPIDQDGRDSYLDGKDGDHIEIENPKVPISHIKESHFKHSRR